MLKQIKLMSVMALVLTNTIESATDMLTAALNMGNTNAATLAAAALLAEGAYCLSQRDFDDKGNYRTVGGDDDSMTSDIPYSCAYGTGMTVLENIRDGVTTNVTW